MDIGDAERGHARGEDVVVRETLRGHWGLRSS
jgi:hypothetical protein